jgi:adenylate kinase
LVRQLVQEGNVPLIKQRMLQGELVPDEVVVQAIKKELQKVSDQDVVFDSYPRRVSQLKLFDPGIDVAIYLDLSDDELKKRLTKRGRADDVPEVIANRLKVYHQETQPILDHYQNEGKLVTIDGHGSTDQVYARIKQALGV